MIDTKVHYQRLYEVARGKYAFHAATKSEVAIWQVEFRRALRDALGLGD